MFYVKVRAKLYDMAEIRGIRHSDPWVTWRRKESFHFSASRYFIIFAVFFFMLSGKFAGQSFRLDLSLISCLVLALVSLCSNLNRPTRCVHRRRATTGRSTACGLKICYLASTPKELRCPVPLRLNQCFCCQHNYVMSTPFNSLSAVSSSVVSRTYHWKPKCLAASCRTWKWFPLSWCC